MTWLTIAFFGTCAVLAVVFVYLMVMYARQAPFGPDDEGDD